MLQLSYDRLDEPDRLQDMVNLAEYIVAQRGIQRDHHLLQRLIEKVGVRVPNIYNDEFCRSALDYHLAVLLAEIGKPDLITSLITQSGILSGSGELIFSDMARDGVLFERARIEAAARGMPSFFIASMPRAASASLTQTIAGTLGLPVMRLSIGHYPEAALILPWLQRFMSGGGVAHDHFCATLFNLGVIRDAGIKDVFVLIRDPRASTASLVHHKAKGNFWDLNASEQEAWLASFFNSAAIPWLKTWVEAEQKALLNVHWIRYADVTGPDQSKVYHDMFNCLVDHYPALKPFVSQPIATLKANFVAGDDEAWRLLVSDETSKKLYNAIPERIIELLGLHI